MGKQETLTLSVKEFCALVPMSVTTYYQMKRAGQGPRELRIGRHVRITRQAVENWLARLDGRPRPPDAE